MKTIVYDQVRANRLLPLLQSIARELYERRAVLIRLEQDLKATEPSQHTDDDLLGLLSEIATHRREIRRICREFEALNCTLVGEDPIVVRVPSKPIPQRRARIWHLEDPV